MVAVSGFTTILGVLVVSVSGRGYPGGRIVLDVPFNPTYGLSLES